MEYILTEEQLDKVMKSYFDFHFENSNFNDKIKTEDYTWTGYEKVVDGKKIMLVGYSPDTSDTWFYNGECFANGFIYFNINYKEFAEAMKRYLNKKYNLDIQNLM